MKNIQSIVSNLCQKNHFKRINTIRIIEQLMATLPYNLRKSFRYFSIKGDTLLIAFNHPTSVSEFNSFKRQILLQVLEQIKISHQNPQEIKEIKHITNIQAFLPKDILDKFDIVGKSSKPPQALVIQCYKERAKGDFKILESHPFYEQFSRIKALLQDDKSHR